MLGRMRRQPNFRDMVASVMLWGCGQAQDYQLKNLGNTDHTQILLERYAPVVMLHPQEQYLPMDLDIYYQHLGASKDEAFYTSGRAAFEHGAFKAVVAHASDDGRFLQYWFFYPKNGCQGARVQYRPDGGLTNPNKPDELYTFELCNLAVHEGDWEHLSVHLTADLNEISEVFFSQQGEGLWLPAGAVELTADGRPITYAALNSHANYPHRLGIAKLRCIEHPLLQFPLGIKQLDLGDIVAAPIGGTGHDGALWRWDTKSGLVVWGTGTRTAYADYLGAWGLEIDARSVLTLEGAPTWLSREIQFGAALAFKLVPELKGKSDGRPPVSPWGRSEWANFNWLP